MVPINEKKSEDRIAIDERLSHIAFIMDGNGRWAEGRGMPREYGHLEGAKTFCRIAAYCQSIGIPCVTVYAFSTENWKRPQREVCAILDIIEKYVIDRLENLSGESMHVCFVGNLSVLPLELQEKIKKLDFATAHHSFRLNIALNYGGREEILHACTELIRKGDPNITESDIAANLYTKGCPDPDLIVRTGGDTRISNFLLWQSAYAEYCFCDVLWPDYTERDVDAAIAAFYSRHRRFGGI
ncbi:MAG: di-trans,poly-cis-decaprenylcistransferase [Clostridia bacterium]|nr:di-trans,poly-cis-decaprenylcistransferase [Clostridia bacterium]